MSGSDLLLDTNIVIYLLEGDQRIAHSVKKAFLHVSFITRMELLAGYARTDEEVEKVERFLEGVRVLGLDAAIEEAAIALRRRHRTKLPDAIIAATALVENLPLLSADKDFARIEEIQFIRYEL